jgi:signal transduction histidine kinase
LESQNIEMSHQRDELVLLNAKIKEINLLQLRFFTNISHEFQTPLTLIISPLERLLIKHKKDKELNKTLGIINRNAHRLLLLIKQLLEKLRLEIKTYM